MARSAEDGSARASDGVMSKSAPKIETFSNEQRWPPRRRQLGIGLLPPLQRIVLVVGRRLVDRRAQGRLRVSLLGDRIDSPRSPVAVRSFGGPLDSAEILAGVGRRDGSGGNGLGD